MQKAGRRNEKKNIPAKKKSNWSRMANVNKNRKEKLGSGEGLLSTPSPPRMHVYPWVEIVSRIFG